MRRVALTLILAVVVAAGSGCVAVVGNRGSFQAPAKRVVVIDKQVYVVDVYDGSVKKIDPKAFAEAAIIQLEDED
ncbi:MAG: hypothetical protein IIB57_05075 [Planctomycetes bacterium]|nr:hypothetical protein [Planctomycetota bacterium]